MLFRLAVVSLCCAGLSACELFSRKPKALRPAILGFPKANTSDGIPREPRLAGTIAMVNTTGNFVLIECDTWSAPEDGTAVKCLRYGAETAILNVGKERRGTYVVADIVKGSPQRGDQVFQ